MKQNATGDELLFCSYFKRDCEGNKIFENHCHSSYEIILVLEGQIRVVTDQLSFSAVGCSVVVFPPFLYHIVDGSGSCVYERITVSFDRSAIPDCIADAFIREIRRYPVISTARTRSVAKRLKDCLTRIDAQAQTPLKNALMTELLYAIAMPDGQHQQIPRREQDKTVAKIISYVQSNIDKQITLDSLASLVFLSKSTVCHLFKRKMKISVKQYVLQKKISYATALIKQGTPAVEASKAVGYGNYANFYAIYKKVTGKSPAQIKLEGKENKA